MSFASFKNLKIEAASACKGKYLSGSFSDIEWFSSDLSGTMFNNCKFKNVAFKNINFSGATLVKCSQEKLTFEQCVFNGEGGGKLQDISLNSSKLKEVIFEHLDLTKVNFEGANLESVVFKNCVLNNCSFKGCNLETVKFENTKLDDVEFTGARNLKLENFDNVNCELITSADSCLDRFFSRNFQSIVIEPIDQNAVADCSSYLPPVPPRSSVSLKLSSDMKSSGVRDEDGKPKQPNITLQRARTKLVHSAEDIEQTLSLNEMEKYVPIQNRIRSRRIDESDQKIIEALERNQASLSESDK
ncbi:pentapeptide repeat-containing protein [Shewanella sp. 202IG2-18]|uniref:pentapeptide repeat-containing protein n=1 Tax=Parashewanella hymeniacidonis TaxID=2807618 RepID=UPI0019608BAF|nr:pentapeptide repeat-containing protein [Parashewanella hymeniacidonis]MBM7070460.1 pentapeptide repeat-containing protein [Parashewanella hymeniacidonis]